MEKNFISRYQPTCFYVNMPERQYGVYVNIKDIDRAEEIIKEYLKEDKTCIGIYDKDGEIKAIKKLNVI